MKKNTEKLFCRISCLAVGVIIGGPIGCMISLFSDFGFSNLLATIKCNPAMFADQYAGVFIVLNIFGILFGIIILMYLLYFHRKQRANVST